MEAIQEGLLKVEPGLLLWTIITFAVLVLILWKAAWKPVVEALDARAERFAVTSRMLTDQDRRLKSFWLSTGK